MKLFRSNGGKEANAYRSEDELSSDNLDVPSRGRAVSRGQGSDSNNFGRGSGNGNGNGNGKTYFQDKRRSSTLSRNSSGRSVSCSAKTIKCGTGIRTFGGSGNSGATGVTRSTSMHQSINQFRAMYEGQIDNSHRSFVSDLDLESAEMNMASIGEGSIEAQHDSLKHLAGLVPQHDTEGTCSSEFFPSTDFTLASGISHNNSHNSKYSSNDSKNGRGRRQSFRSLVADDVVDDDDGQSNENSNLDRDFDNLSIASTSVMMDKTRAQNVGRSGTKIVYIVLLVTGLIVTSGIYWFGRLMETRKFELEFRSFARETADLAELNADHTFSQLKTMTTTVTSEGMLERERMQQFYNQSDGTSTSATETSWPNVTIPHFDQRIMDFSESFGATMLLYVPLVVASERDSWEHYANENAPWTTAASNNSTFTHRHTAFVPSTSLAGTLNMNLVNMNNNDNVAPLYDIDIDDVDHDYLDDDHEGSDRHLQRRNLQETESYPSGMDSMSTDNHTHNGFLRIHACTHLHFDETRFADVDEDSILRIKGKFDNPEGISAPIYQYGGQDLQRSESNTIALMDLWTHPVFRKEVLTSIEYNISVISEYLDMGFLGQGFSTSDDVSSLWNSDEEHANSAMNSNLTLPSVQSLTLHPVKETFEPDARTIGFVVGVVPWSTYFSNVLKPATSTVLYDPSAMYELPKGDARQVNGIVVKVVSDCGSVFTFVMNAGSAPSQVRLGDWKEQYEKYEYLNQTSRFLPKEHINGSMSHCHFTLHIYPNDEFRNMYRRSNISRWYAMIGAGIFLFTAFVFGCYDSLIFKGQRHIVNEASGMIVQNARRAAKNERELNDFIAHEVRNPLAAAISACSFVSSAIMDDQQRMNSNNDKEEELGETERLALIASNEKREEVLDDINIIDSSLNFINDLLRNMLDMQRAGSNQIHIERKPTDIMNDIFKPVEAMMHLRDSPFTVKMEINSGIQNEGDEDSEDDDQLVIMADPIRLKQVLLNLTRNATKFVEQGFIRCSANVNPINGFVELRVDDSGPGIPAEKRSQVFGKFQQSLDSLQQGTGIGLSLCKKMVDLMGGCLFIDEDYNSGIKGCPGTRFVIQLRIPPLQLNKMTFAPEISTIDRARLRRRHLLACTEEKSPSLEKQSSSHSLDILTDSVNSSVTFNSKSINTFDANISESESDRRIQEPVAIVAEIPTGGGEIIEEEEDEKKQGSTMLPLPIALLSTGEVVTDNTPDAIDDCKGQQSDKRVVLTELPKNLSVLFVDDDMVLRKLFSRTLKKINPTWNCKEASSGETAIDLLTSRAESSDEFNDEPGGGKKAGDCGFDLIFMDQYMASVTKQLLGTETVRAIRAKGFNKPIICGLSANDVEDAFYHAGCDAFMFKPFPCKKDELKKELLKVMNSRIRGSRR